MAARNPRRVALAQVREIMRLLRPMLSVWDQSQTTWDKHHVREDGGGVGGFRPLREVEKRENSAAYWLQLESYARAIADKASALAAFAATQAYRAAQTKTIKESSK